ncbi:MAG TPA: VWA domain-containing protein [Solirubrobacterales bacterium]|nr:VWA domain-containing protein [Solirubrobacterales bacterium]
MIRRAAAPAVIALLLAVAAPPAIAAPALSEPQPSPVAIVLDTSGSMTESDGSASGRIKIDGAKIALLDFLQQVEPGTPIGLRNYPAEGEATESEEGCSAGKAQFEIQQRDPTAMAALIRTLQADGDTPTAAALQAAADEIARAGGTQGTIVLVSDGESNCGRDPCEVAREIAESGIDLQTITVGFQVSGAGAQELQCIADQTGGKYISANDSATLAEAFDEISRPQIHLGVTYPRVALAQVGNDRSGLARIEAVVTNTGQRIARGTFARIGFDVAAGAPAVVRPVVFLGNLEPGEERRVAWSFRPSVPPADRNPMPLPFTVIAGAQNSVADAEFEATIQVRDAFETAADAGPILAGRKTIAILGDSFSAGEGADEYIDGTDTDENPCHRSRRTYLIKAFALPDTNIIACSGAVTNDFQAPQPGHTEDPQIDQLKALGQGQPVEAVVLTIGGNDFGFKKVVISCVIDDCSRRIYGAGELVPAFPKRSDKFVEEQIHALGGALQTAYTQVNGVVNQEAARAAAGGPVPILVPAYPLPTPLTAQHCPQMFERLSPTEIKFLVELGGQLNSAIEKATEAARDDGIPAFYVPNTEMAFQPDHTVCHGEPYARSLASFNGAGVNGRELIDALEQTVWRIGPVTIPNPIDRLRAKLKLTKAQFGALKRGFIELVHPTQGGYAAETRAILRWSQSPDAEAAASFLAASPAAPSGSEIEIETSGFELGQLSPGQVPVLQGGTAYPLQAGGFEPQTQVQIVVHSAPRVLGEATASERGAVELEVVLPPDLAPGEHELTLTGVGGDGEPREIVIPFRIAGDSLPSTQEALLLGGLFGLAASALCGLIAFLSGRRRRLSAGEKG